MSGGRIRRMGPDEVRSAGDALDWLARTGGPLRVDVPGADPSRTRVVTTLLHGNEPSGVRALHHWLQGEPRPAVGIVAFAVSVPAALGPPPFTLRSLPGEPDLNRCFGGPSTAPSAELAAELLDQIRELQPEALVDLHNTSSLGPAYAVVTGDDPERQALTANFASRMVVTDLRLGALTEALEGELPAVVVECGGSGDPAADAVALAGLESFASGKAFQDESVTLLRHPIRVEIAPSARLCYAQSPDPDADLTLDAEISRHNFAPAPAGTRLGWLGPQGLEILRARRGDGREFRDALFESAGRELRLRRDTQLLMATEDPAVAHGDCAFYAVQLGEGESQPL